QTGQNVTLNCRYDIRKEGALHACWNKGEIPSRGGCNNKLISTDGYKVIKKTRVSSRYQLLGRLDEGDVSLIILNLTEEDAGLYGCLVEIPGWFNDLKHHFGLSVEKGLRKGSFLRHFSLSQTVCTVVGGVEQKHFLRWRRTRAVPQALLYLCIAEELLQYMGKNFCTLGSKDVTDPKKNRMMLN
uniref:Ig-like domain-containing protein n=1 Tax=Cyprinodon variegatus TaxID=28743 RepID=A0A3Q2CW99_CYPVA